MKRQYIKENTFGALNILGSLILSRLDEEMNGEELEDFSSIEVETMLDTLEDERATRLSARAVEASETLGKRQFRPKPSRATKVRISYGSTSPIGEYASLLAFPICPVCFMWGGVEQKRKDRPLCSKHIPQRPYFKCVDCDKISDAEFWCCDKRRNQKLWPFTPDHLKEKPRLPRWMWAQLIQRGIDMFERCCEELEVSERAVYEEVKKVNLIVGR